jgi:hypothetical protein
LFGADRELAAVDNDVDVGSFAVVGAGVIAHDDGAVWFDDERGAVRETDASAAVGLGLNGVAGIKLRVGVGRDSFARCGPDDADVAFERDEPGAGRIVELSGIFEGVAVLPDVKCGAGGHAAEHENGDYQIDEALLNNPPIKGKMTGLIRHHFLDRGGVQPKIEQQD